MHSILSKTNRLIRLIPPRSYRLNQGQGNFRRDRIPKKAYHISTGKMKAAATEDEIETLISSLPLIRYLRSSALTAESASTSASVPLYREFRLHSNMPPKSLSAHMVGGSLFAPDKLPVYPRLFIQTQPTCSIIAVFYIGRHLCGHPGYVHGGVLFSLFDDIFARCSALILPNGIGMTANMNINFRKPSLPDRVYILRAEVASHEGRKSFVNGSIRSLAPFTADDLMQLEATSDGDLSIQEQEADLVAEASSLFIEPKFADSMESIFRNF